MQPTVKLLKICNVVQQKLVDLDAAHSVLVHTVVIVANFNLYTRDQHAQPHLVFKTWEALAVSIVQDTHPVLKQLIQC